MATSCASSRRTSRQGARPARASGGGSPPRSRSSRWRRRFLRVWQAKPHGSSPGSRGGCSPRWPPRRGRAPPRGGPAPARRVGGFGRRHTPASPADQAASPARRWPLLAAAAVLAVAAAWGLARQAGVGAEIQRLRDESRQLAARAEALERQVEQAQAEAQRLGRMLSIITAPGVKSVSLAGMGTSHSAAGRTYVNPADRKAAFVASNLPALGPDKTYQLWYLDGEGQKTSGGLFGVDAQGSASLVIDQPVPVEIIEGWVVTVEPRGGRPQPTGSMVLAG